MILKIAVCDDEPVICQKLISDLKQMNEGFEIDEFHDGETILQSNNAYDVIF